MTYLFLRSYISFDILRRVLSDYFNYDVQYVMNITDIDDKIIKRARQHYLFEQYVKEGKTLSQILEDVDAVVKRLKETLQNTTDPDKKVMLDQMLSRVVVVMSEVEAAVKSKIEENIVASKEVKYILLKSSKETKGFE